MRIPDVSRLLKHVGSRIRTLRKSEAARAAVGPRQLNWEHAGIDEASRRLQHRVHEASYDMGTGHRDGFRHKSDGVFGHAEDRYGGREGTEVHPRGNGALADPDMAHVGDHGVLRQSLVPRRGLSLLRRALSMQEEQ